jgi:hypothetical protein
MGIIKLSTITHPNWPVLGVAEGKIIKKKKNVLKDFGHWGWPKGHGGGSTNPK